MRQLAPYALTYLLAIACAAGLATQSQAADAPLQVQIGYLGYRPDPGPVLSNVNRLRRSRDDRWLGGVCGGVARLTGMESWVWRMAFALLFLFWGAGLLLYILLWIFVPDE